VFDALLKAVSSAENMQNDNDEGDIDISDSVSEDSDEIEFEADEKKTVIDNRDLWLEKQEQEDEKESAVFKAQNFSQALMEATYQKMMLRMERNFHTDLFSIPFIEDPDLNLQTIPKPYQIDNLYDRSSEPKNEDQEEIQKSILLENLKTESVSEIGPDWINMQYDFSNLITTQLSNRLSGSSITTPLKHQISEFNFDEFSLKKLLNVEKKRTVTIGDDLEGELFSDLNLKLPYQPEKIEQDRYYESRPKQESKQEGVFTGMFLNMLKKVDDDPAGIHEVIEDQRDQLPQEETHTKNMEPLIEKGIQL
jgi:hypothetical protein